MPRRTVAVVACLIALLAGCSSSSKKSSSTTSSTVAGATTSTTVNVPKAFTGGDLATFCAAWKDIKAATAQPLPAGASSQQVKDRYSQITPIAKRLDDAAPQEIKSSVDVALRINNEVASSGSTAAFDSDENKRNGSLIAAYADQHCPAK